MTNTLMIAVIAVALAFDFFNGFNDSANAIATIVITKTLKPWQAVLLAATANFVGYFAFGVAVAETIGKGVVRVDFIELPILLAALLGAILWDIIAWRLGLPTSSSHALIGGLVGAALVCAGPGAIVMSGLGRIVLFIAVAPLLGMTGAVVFTNIVLLFARNARPKPANRVFKRLQLVSASIYAVAHGTNDAQKSMGIIALALLAGGVTKVFTLERWVVLACYSAMAVGTLFGGWRIVKTVGSRITRIRPMEGFCAETSSAIVMLLTAHMGIPVSTTHVIAGSIMGVGTVEGAARVKWVTARRIVLAWLITIPFTAACSALVYLLISLALRLMA
jgi:inorganic phosphate transporter, PiT family